MGWVSAPPVPPAPALGISAARSPARHRSSVAWPALRGLEGTWPLACRLGCSSQVPAHWLPHTNGILLNSGHLAIRMSPQILFWRAATEPGIHQPYFSGDYFLFCFHQNTELSMSPHWTEHWLFHTFFPVYLFEDRPENFLQSLLHQSQRTWLRHDTLFLQMTRSLMWKHADDKNSFRSLGKEQTKSACSLSSSLPTLCFLSVILNTRQLVAGCCLCGSLHSGFHATLSQIRCSRQWFSLFLKGRFFQTSLHFAAFRNHVVLILN